MVICNIHKAKQTLQHSHFIVITTILFLNSVGDQIPRDSLGPVALLLCPTGNLDCCVSQFLALMSQLLPEYIINESNPPKVRCKSCFQLSKG